MDEPRRHDPVYGRPLGYGDREESHSFRERAARLDDSFFRRDRERMERERMERERMERERIERDRIERDRIERERERLERERVERERIERDRIERERMERDRMERDRLERERMEQRERASLSGYTSLGRDGPTYSRPYGQASQYGGDLGAREPAPWMRQRQEQQPIEQPPTSAPPPTSMGYEYPRNSAQPYAYGSHESRYTPSQFSTAAQSVAASHFDGQQDRQRVGAISQQQQSQQQQQVYTGNPGSSGYRLQESPRGRPNEDPNQLQRGVYLGIQQEINRKGRNSPFPQAVQGAQGQLNGPGGEPGIKTEFGKMFSGIGSGVGSLGAAGVSSGGAQSPFSNQGQLRRDELESPTVQESMAEAAGHKIARPSSRGGRRRRLKDEDGRVDDDSSGGRRTPSGRASKRPKSVIHPTQRQ